MTREPDLLSEIILDPELLHTATKRVLTVQAHADDETITMGGTLALCKEAGIATAVVCCTDGTRATIYDPKMPEAETRPKLGRIRQQELRTACSILGVSAIHFLNYGDSDMAGSENNQTPDAFWMANMDEAVRKIVKIIRGFRPQAMVVYDSFGGYGHPDHVQAHRVGQLAFDAATHPQMYPELGEPWTVEQLYYTAIPRSYFHKMMEVARANGVDLPFGDDNAERPRGTADELVTTVVDYASLVNKKVDAMLAHRSQIQPDWPFVAALQSPLGATFAKEFFSRVRINPPGDPITDFLASLVPADVAP